MARQLVLPAVLWISRLSGGSVMFNPGNMNVTLGTTIGLV